MPLFAIIVLITVPSVAFANAGLPMLAVVLPLSLPAFIPVVAIESWVIRRELNIDWRLAVKKTTVANVWLMWSAEFGPDRMLVFRQTDVLGFFGPVERLAFDVFG